mmetsp:Transcript_38354/g.96077  ORF Transcript_38354/g.96077 Transcript_38354/m.96077 type:complete len:256 (-) Transcript_38354:263-1030(-)
MQRLLTIVFGLLVALPISSSVPSACGSFTSTAQERISQAACLYAQTQCQIIKPTSRVKRFPFTNVCYTVDKPFCTKQVDLALSMCKTSVSGRFGTCSEAQFNAFYTKRTQGICAVVSLPSPGRSLRAAAPRCADGEGTPCQPDWDGVTAEERHLADSGEETSCSAFNDRVAQGVAHAACSFAQSQCLIGESSLITPSDAVCYLVERQTCVSDADYWFTESCASRISDEWGSCSERSFYRYFQTQVRHTCSRLAEE